MKGIRTAYICGEWNQIANIEVEKSLAVSILHITKSILHINLLYISLLFRRYQDLIKNQIPSLYSNNFLFLPNFSKFSIRLFNFPWRKMLRRLKATCW